MIQNIRAKINRAGKWYFSLPILKAGLINLIFTSVLAIPPAIVALVSWSLEVQDDRDLGFFGRYVAAYSWLLFHTCVICIDLPWMFCVLQAGVRRIFRKNDS
jgi:preprotein translocase subunit SecY